MNQELEDIRGEIDAIDKQLLALFLQRMTVAEKIAQIKIRDGLPLYNGGREEIIINRICEETLPDISGYAVSFFRNLIELSKSRQREIFSTPEQKTPLLSQLSAAAAPIAHPRVLVQGVRGANSSQAAMRIYPDCEISYVRQWEEVLYGVEAGMVDYGVLPVENSSAGSISEVFDIMLHHRLSIVRALPLAIDHCLLGVRGAKLADVREVFSNSYVYPQCKEFFAKHYRIQKSPYLNTAMAAQYVALEGDKTKAAVASRENAHLYGLDILEQSIQDGVANCTRFISVACRPEITESANKISVVFALPHVTGSLCRTLSRFANAGLNLTKIESYPKPGRNFEYYFYVDFTGSVRSDTTRGLLAALSEELPDFYFFGNYYEA
ncbi:MAG: prephenate dehydratase domain-containing protein [Clostridia bacterium]|nr:prephenate dehydratase domain-containing protein [Clostridia bacterium]MDR3644418.1 prephenate dehydratase domain-containing protein [Clostridia bacterium]